MNDSSKVFFLSLRRALIVTGVLFIVERVINTLFSHQSFLFTSFMFPILIGAISGLRVYWTASTATLIKKISIYFIVLWGILWLTFTYIPTLSDGILYNALASLLLSAFLTGIQAVFVKERLNS